MVLVVAGIVGWLCQRIGLSVVVGFLVAGIVAGPQSPAFTLVRDAGRIGTLAQVGLVFLMFSIGLRLSLRKMRRLGPGLMLATFCGLVEHGKSLFGGHADGVVVGDHREDFA